MADFNKTCFAGWAKRSVPINIKTMGTALPLPILHGSDAPLLAYPRRSVGTIQRYSDSKKQRAATLQRCKNNKI